MTTANTTTEQTLKSLRANVESEYNAEWGVVYLDNARLLRCVTMAMGCISPLSPSVDERLAWYRLLDAVEGREPRQTLPKELRPPQHDRR